MLPDYEPGAYDLDAHDTDEAKELWDALYTWVEWLRATYQLGAKIQPCWYRHPPLVRELIALFAEWRGAYEEEADPAAPAIWHNRSLWPMIGRLNDLANPTQCGGPPCQFTPRTPRTDPDGFAEYVAADRARRAAPSPDKTLPDEITPDQAAQLLMAGEAEPVDPDDESEQGPFVYEDHRWEYDPADEVFRRT